MAEDPTTHFYKRSKFSTRLPKARHYTQGHFWLEEVESGLWRIGFTRFATRMLGEVVEYDFEAQPGQAVEVGDPVGWVEGFKAITELYSPAAGAFHRSNPELADVLESIHAHPYDKGWLYEIRGALPSDALDVDGYVGFLDATIAKMTGKDA